MSMVFPWHYIEDGSENWTLRKWNQNSFDAFKFGVRENSEEYHKHPRKQKHHKIDQLEVFTWGSNYHILDTLYEDSAILRSPQFGEVESFILKGKRRQWPA